MMNESYAPEKLKILKEARKLIASPDRWVQHTFHRIRENGVQAFCLMGAVNLAQARNDLGSRTGFGVNHFLSDRLRTKGYYFSPESFNDSAMRTHTQVIEFLDDSIAYLESIIAQEAKKRGAH